MASGVVLTSQCLIKHSNKPTTASENKRLRQQTRTDYTLKSREMEIEIVMKEKQRAAQAIVALSGLSS